MRRPISIAMALSVVIHLALFMAMEWLLSDMAEPSISNTVLLVSIQPPQAEEGYSADEKHVAPAANSEAAIPERNREAAKSSDQQSTIMRATKTIVAAESHP